jgi:tight adherence protein C
MEEWLRAVAALIGERLPRPARLDPDELRRAGMDAGSAAGLSGLKPVLAGSMAVLVLLAAAVLPPVLMLAPVLVWGAYMAPSLYVSRRRSARQARVARELPDFIGLVKSFVNSGMPLEQALHLVASQILVADSTHVLAGAVSRSMAAYGLGEPLADVLQHMAAELGVDDVAMLVTAVVQAKRVGSAMEPTLREQEMLARMAQRNRATAAASQVGNRLMGVLVGVYLPEFLCLVMVPLFWGIVSRTFD